MYKKIGCGLMVLALLVVIFGGATFAAVQWGAPLISRVVAVATTQTTPSATFQRALAPVTPVPTAQPAPAINRGQVAGSNQQDQLLVNLYKQVNPAVVNIRVRSGPSGAQQRQNPNSRQPNSPFGIPQGQPQVQGEGSGVVYDTQGHIITNNHVIEGATEVEVTFWDDVTVPARVVGTDPDSDLAVIQVQVDQGELHPVPLGDSDALQVGQQVIAIGNPFGLQGTLTTGIVSALGRSLPAGETSLTGGRYSIPDVIQTDAAINPGNSGGALLNLQGEVVGITNAIESPVRANSGVGFAIPSAIVKRVVPALIQNGRYEHAWLGVSVQTVGPDLARALGLTVERGAQVMEVTANSPAAQAGLRGSGNRQVQFQGQSIPAGGDVIIAIDSQPVRKSDDLISYLTRSTRVGQTVQLTILRDGQQQTVSVKLAARPGRG